MSRQGVAKLFADACDLEGCLEGVEKAVEILAAVGNADPGPISRVEPFGQEARILCAVS